MPSSRASLVRNAIATALPALLVIPAACGGDSSSADFCGSAEQVTDMLSDIDISDRDTEQLADLAEALDDVEPPPEVADDWNAMAAIYQAAADSDLADPSVLDDLDNVEIAGGDHLSDISVPGSEGGDVTASDTPPEPDQTSATAAGVLGSDELNRYLQEDCGIDASS